MGNYLLISGSTTLVNVDSSSSLENPTEPSVRRGTVFRTLGGVRVQYLSSVSVMSGEDIVWTIPYATPAQHGTLFSASVGNFGDSLLFSTPFSGSNISVAFKPASDGFQPRRHQLPYASQMYEITCRLIRLS